MAKESASSLYNQPTENVWFLPFELSAAAEIPPSMPQPLRALALQNAQCCGLTELILNDYDVSPDLLEYEITESLAMNHLDRALPVLQELRARGRLLSIDDFRTG